jgi:predicted enzyme related to lactoylglutathione lyase
MKTPLYLLVAIIFLAACGPDAEVKEAHNTEAKTQDSEPAALDTTPKVTGIGGIFFTTPDPEGLKNWYGENLGLVIDPYGSPFEFRNADRPDEINYLRWSTFPDSVDAFAPSEREFMINYRVQNIEGLVRNLEASGINMVDSILSVEYGKFVHFMDPGGNKVELWEPIDSFLTELGGETTK